MPASIQNSATPCQVTVQHDWAAAVLGEQRQFWVSVYPTAGSGDAVHDTLHATAPADGLPALRSTSGAVEAKLVAQVRSVHL
jgi:hypothetical protein